MVTKTKPKKTKINLPEADEIDFVTLPDLAERFDVSDRLYRMVMQWLAPFEDCWYAEDFETPFLREDFENWATSFVPEITVRTLNGLVREGVAAGLLIVTRAPGEVTLKRGPVLDVYAKAFRRRSRAA
jgi:hypothetical protein